MIRTAFQLISLCATFAPLSAQTISTPYCFGDGTGAACPCGNVGAPGTGCGNSFGGAVLLTARGNAGTSMATDTLVLTVNSGPWGSFSSWGFFFQGTSRAGGGLGVPFGDGLLCVSGTITRLGIVFQSSGIASYPGGPTPAPIHVAGATSAGDVRHYQAMYRDSQFPFCSAATTNVTNGLTVTWGP